ncbi:hypothetical protein [Marinobacter sp. OP 3.4]|uniref:hypothetical protein n=1 Tax=Marinobacter sp. OP 3.4 TaxID=3076501 RepID=UPI002E21BA3A
MPKSKHNRKRHDATRRAQTFFGHRTRVLTFEADRDHPGADQNAYARKHMGAFWKDLGPEIVGAVLRYPQNWAVCIRAVCWTGEGDWWVEENTIIARDIALQDLEQYDLYKNARDEVLAEVQRRHVYDLGWMAETYLGRNPADHNPRWPYSEINELEIITPERQQLWRQVDEDFQQEQREAA